MNMSNKTKPNDAAFACATSWGHQEGLTKREYFAAMALQGLCANPNESGLFEVNALRAVGMADTLIKELNRGKEK